ncbi:HEAT repeat domain-containing protein [Laspinema palackyanum]|uniref:HEAT repeat domain-containing protein n=1 Tax=Laspinema palackyanum TaxID=3231601 RepID=UPI00345D0EBB|nr:HEAT repeat domain-containing protein [Laspinema sp. D2c]
MEWQDFLREQAKNHALSPEETDTLLKRFPEKERYITNEAQFTAILNEGISDKKHQIGEDAITKRMQKIYQKFEQDCPKLQQSSRGKLGILRQWLIAQFIVDSKPLNRCILGLKGNYEDAQQKLTEITQTLQTRLNDKTLSIAKVEKGSIILIVESSQTGYEQFKTLIGQKIGEFEVEYAIDEWQAICRQMLIDRKPLTSNTVLGQVYGNRNLIDDDLFVDLALVKPKRSQNPKHPQDIDPEKGSDLFTRQEETIEKRFDYREFLQEVICNRTEKQMAIIGEPGAGKTTLLQKLAFWLLQETDDLVIWVSLAELGNQPLGEYLEQKWLKEALGLSREEIKADWRKKFEAGAVWLLLDGLDEMSQSDQQALNFRGWVMNAPMIITCRLNLWQANPSQLQGFQTYLTQPFQDEQVQEFIRRWFPVQADAESLWSELQAAGKERIKDLCRNPLRLTLLCATWKVEDALPETMAELYAEFVEAIYKWKKKAFTVKKEEKKQLNAALGALAKASLEAETSRFRLTHRLVCEYFGELDEDSLVLRLGWLNEVGVAEESLREKVYTFYHATFQEYFAALAVEDWDDFLPRNHGDSPVEGKRYRIFEPQWKQVILLWLGRDIGQDNKQAFIRALVEFNDGVRDFYGFQAYFLAAAAINEFKACSLADEIVRQFVRGGFGYFNTEKQEWTTFLDPIKEGARNILGETIRQKAIAALEEILRDAGADNSTRRQAAESLGKIAPGNQQAIAALEEILRDAGADDSTRGRAAEILGTIAPGNPQAIAALVEILRDAGADDSTRGQAAESLGKIAPGNQQAIAALVEILRDAGAYNFTRWQAAESLGKIAPGNQQEIAALALEEILRDAGADNFTRILAANSLEKIAPGNQQAIAALVEILRDAGTDYSTRMLVAPLSLGKIAPGNQQALAALVEILGDAGVDDDTRRLAAESLGEIAPGNPQALAALVEILRDAGAGSYTRRRAAFSLEKIAPGNQQALAALVEILRDAGAGSYTRRRAAFSLGKIAPGNQQAIAALEEILRDAGADDSIRREAAESLGKIAPGNPQAIAALVEILRDAGADDSTRRQAAESLGKIAPGNQQALAALVEILRDVGADKYTRMHAANSLGKIAPGNQQALAALVEILRDTGADNDTRMQAAESLGKILTTRQHYAGVVSALKDCLSDEVYQNDFIRFKECYKLIWNCAENLPYPEFYQAWHHPTTTPHPEVTEQTPHKSEPSFAPINLAQALQNQPILILNAQPLAQETREGEIALTLCGLIWKQVCPQRMYPRVSTPADLCYAIDELKFTLNLPHRALLLTDCEHPTPELIAFCEKLIRVIAVAFLTDEPLEAPLKGFPPNQANLISAIETWLEEI